MKRLFARKREPGSHDDVSEEKRDLLQSTDMFSLKRSYWDHPIEAEIYKALRELICDEYIIVPHESISNIFYWKWDADWKNTDRVTKMHFDFAVYDEDYRPVFLVEVNGKEHEKHNKAEIDNFKTALSEKVGLKLVIIDATQTIVNPRKEAEERVRQEFPDRASCPTYCPACHSQIPMMLQKNGKTGDCFYGCANKECGVTHSLGKSGEFRKIAPLYRNMPVKATQ